MKFRLIDAEKAHVPVKDLCALLGVSSSGYYAWRKRPDSRRKREDEVYLVHIRSIFAESRESYGRPRMVAELQERGFQIGHHRVGRLMRDNQLTPKRTRRHKRTTDSRHDKPVAANLLAQDFTATRADEKWAVDISYLWTVEGWLYLAVVIDLYSRKVVGWAVSNRMKQDLVIRALKMALTLRQPPPGFIHHSDRGSQYCAHAYIALLESHGARISMSGKGNCFDNAVAETFFKTLKAELVWRTIFMTREQAIKELENYINGFYNPIRKHSYIGYKSPCQFETMNA